MLVFIFINKFNKLAPVILWNYFVVLEKKKKLNVIKDIDSKHEKSPG